MNRHRTFQRGAALRRGAALVEFALVSSLLFLLLFGIIEVGLILGDQAQVAQAARAAARSAAVGSTVETAQSAAVSAGTGLNLAPSSVSLESSAGGTVWIALGDAPGGTNTAVSGSLIRATVSYNHPLVTTFVFSGSAKRLTSQMVMQRE